MPRDFLGPLPDLDLSLVLGDNESLLLEEDLRGLSSENCLPLLALSLNLSLAGLLDLLTGDSLFSEEEE